MEYAEFLKSKVVGHSCHGKQIDPDSIHPLLFPFERAIVAWACHKGQAAVFADCGLGKTLMQLEWARLMGGRSLIVAPLAVAQQTIREGKKINVPVKYVRNQDQCTKDHDIFICNYEMVHHFDPGTFDSVVLDESSILKSFTGKTKRLLLDMFSVVPYRLACTATPAPNDHLEFGNHAEFLGVMESRRMISRWFVNDSMQAGVYRLKGHAEQDFWKWVTTWAVCLSKPSDLSKSFDDDGFVLPELKIHNHMAEVDHRRAHKDGQLFVIGTQSATGMWREKKETNESRCLKTKEIVGDSKEPWIIWCETNQEADRLMELFPDAFEVRGSDSIESKEKALVAFTEGNGSKIITKVDIAGYGLNWQHCPNQVFVSLTYSFEKMYQAIRRSWRFGQQSPVNIHIVSTETEYGILDSIQRKTVAHQTMHKNLKKAVAKYGLSLTPTTNLEGVEMKEYHGDNWKLVEGDSIDTIKTVDDESVHLTIFSPPFSTLYIYSDIQQDMGNNEDHESFWEHFSYLIPEIWRITKTGRLCCVHCKDLPLYMNRDGAAGLYDFPGRLIQEFEKPRFGNEFARWVYHSRVTIWKDPVIEMQRTKSHGLLWKNFSARGEVTRQGMADYLIMFRKWVHPNDMPDNQVVNDPEQGDFIGEEGPSSWDSQRDWSIQVWQKYASPVWFDIRQTNVLNCSLARSDKDEKHICPLQLDVIARCIEIWSNKGDIVFSPFAGIGSEGYQALKMGRKFFGLELKPEYIEVAIKNLNEVEFDLNQPTLFDMNGGDE